MKRFAGLFFLMLSVVWGCDSGEETPEPLVLTGSGDVTAVLDA